MDTREKICSLERLPLLLESGDWAVVVGLFDPLTLAQATRLASVTQTGCKLLAIVISEADTLLSAEARAALLAGLRNVRAVAISDRQQWRSFVPSSDRVRIVEDEHQEQQRSDTFVQFVLDRQRSADTVGQEQ